jgi:hypothetical protein
VLLLQEGASVSWDPRFDGPEHFSWFDAATIVVWIVAIYAYWRVLQWFARRRLDHTGWRRTRYVLPTTLMATSAAAVWATDLAFGENIAFNLVVGICAFLNAPALIGAAIVAFAFEGTSAPLWVMRSAAALMGWVSWYVAILLTEIGIESVQPVRLDLSRL